MFSQLFLFSFPILPPPSFASFYFAFFLYFFFRIFPLVIITSSPSCCSYHEIYISTLPSLTFNATAKCTDGEATVKVQTEKPVTGPMRPIAKGEMHFQRYITFEVF